MEEGRDISHNTSLVWRPGIAKIRDVEQSLEAHEEDKPTSTFTRSSQRRLCPHRNAELLLRDAERQLRVELPILEVKSIPIEQIRPMPVDERAQRQTVRPAPGEILDIDSRGVRSSLALDPKE